MVKVIDLIDTLVKCIHGDERSYQTTEVYLSSALNSRLLLGDCG